MFDKKQTYRLDDVYGVSRDVPDNYVARINVDGELIDALARDKHIVVFGSSKQGKTCLRKYNLRDTEYWSITCSNRWSLSQLHTAILKSVGYVVEGTLTRATSGEFKVAAKMKAGLNFGVGHIGAETGGDTAEANSLTTEEQSLELDPADVNDIIDALDKAGAPKLLVLEDFHYLPEDTQRDFAVALKAFHEDSSYCFIVVGVWLDENRLVQYNGDLTGRITAINADTWSDEDLREVVNRGAGLLNIEFDSDFIDQLVDGCFKSVWVVQECCRRACEAAGVRETRESSAIVGAGVSAAHLIKEVVDQNSARYNGFIINFAVGFVTTQLEMYRWLLYPILNSSIEDLEKGLLYGALRRAINDKHPEAPINAGNITQALLSTASLQVGKMAIKPIILDYDQTNRRLNIVDRSFLMWLQHQDREELLDAAELPTY